MTTRRGFLSALAIAPVVAAVGRREADAGPAAEFDVKAKSRNGPEIVATDAITVTVDGKKYRVMLEAKPLP
jgi:hypothetical protein